MSQGGYLTPHVQWRGMMQRDNLSLSSIFLYTTWTLYTAKSIILNNHSLSYNFYKTLDNITRKVWSLFWVAQHQTPFCWCLISSDGPCWCSSPPLEWWVWCMASYPRSGLSPSSVWASQVLTWLTWHNMSYKCVCRPHDGVRGLLHLSPVRLRDIPHRHQGPGESLNAAPVEKISSSLLSGCGADWDSWRDRHLHLAPGRLSGESSICKINESMICLLLYYLPRLGF